MLRVLNHASLQTQSKRGRGDRSKIHPSSVLICRRVGSSESAKKGDGCWSSDIKAVHLTADSKKVRVLSRCIVAIMTMPIIAYGESVCIL